MIYPIVCSLTCDDRAGTRCAGRWEFAPIVAYISNNFPGDLPAKDESAKWRLGFIWAAKGSSSEKRKGN